MAAGRVHEPEPVGGDWNRAATVWEQDSDPDRRDRTELSVECRAYL